MPGSSPTMARRDPTNRLKRLDFPTLGRRTMTIVGTRPGLATSVIELVWNFAKKICSLGTRYWVLSSRYYRDSLASTSQPASCRPRQECTLYQFFSPGGLLSRTHPPYEFRHAQLQMPQAVEQALEEKRHLVVEAGTGTGKTLAYLFPVIRSGKRVIISTGTKNLQEQLFYKDVPFLEQALLGEGASDGRGNQIARLAR